MRKKNSVVVEGILSYEDLDTLMKKLAPKVGVQTVSVIFGTAYVQTYTNPSRIGHNVIGDAPMRRKGYWKNGKIHPFSDKLWVRYHNSNTGHE